MPETINSIAASARHTGAEARFGLKPRGFTLIEVLVALSIMAVMAALTWRGIDGMARAQAATQRYTDDVLTLQAGLTQWRADLDAMMTWPNTDGSTPAGPAGQRTPVAPVPALALTLRTALLAKPRMALSLYWA